MKEEFEKNAINLNVILAKRTTFTLKNRLAINLALAKILFYITTKTRKLNTLRLLISR